MEKITFTVYGAETFFGNIHQNVQIVFFPKPENILYYVRTLDIIFS